MDPLLELSSQSGDRTQAANLRVAERVVADPGLLDRLAEGLMAKDTALVGDAAEVMAMVAERRPELVVPYAARLLPLLEYRHSRSRWEGMKALSLVTHLVPDLIEGRLSQLRDLLERDRSVIVRDHAIDTVAGYASTGVERLKQGLPLLQLALVVSEGRFAARALRGLARVAGLEPTLRPMLSAISEEYLGHGRVSVRNAAKQLRKALP